MKFKSDVGYFPTGRRQYVQPESAIKDDAHAGASIESKVAHQIFRAPIPGFQIEE
jgi:hypothetical protein